jgi:hypothetical protein
MKYLVKLTAAGLVLALASASFAFVEKRPSGAKFTPEQSQEQVAQQQAMNGKYGVLGSEDLVQSKPNVKMGGENTKANEVLIQSSPEARSLANNALVKAEAEVSLAPKPKAPGAVWGILFLVLGAVAVWAFKSYADKVVPDIPCAPKSKMKW